MGTETTKTFTFDPDNLLGPITQKFLQENLYPLYPSFKVRINTKPNFLYNLCDWFLRVTRLSPNFKTNYLTVIDKDIWVNESFVQSPDLHQLSYMMHEATHLADRKRYGTIPYFLAYASPQIWSVLSLLSIGAIWDLWWLLWLLCLLLVAPIPSPGRYWAEMRGYQVNMMMVRRGIDTNSKKDLLGHFVPQFTESPYYWMWPFADAVKNKLQEPMDMNDPWFKQINKWLDENISL